jgi:molybdate transport system substrate-binding protein
MNIRAIVFRWLTLIALFTSIGCRDDTAKAPGAPIKVAAASDLAFAFKDIGAEFEKRTGRQVSFTFGSTGMLAKQIAEGAPFDVFAAANVSFVDDVIKAGACDAETKAPYARGRIVIWSKKAEGFAPPAALADLADARFVKLAIANPEHAPYGRAAKEALMSAGVWEKVEPKIVYGENIQQTLQFAQTRNAEAAIVALSLATVTEGGDSVAIDEGLHKPIDQALVVCKRGTDAKVGRDFATFVGSPEGRAIMKRYGFLLPGEVVGKAL